MIDIEEGDICIICQGGTMEFPEPENCSCHIAPPCSSCTSLELTCEKCFLNESEIIEKYNQGVE